MKNCAKIIAAVTVMFIWAGYAEAYSPSDFTDVFTNPRPMSYCSQSANINGVAGQSGVCAGGLFYYTETVTGFRDQNNPNEPKRLCQKDITCSPEPQVMYMGGTYNSNNNYDGKVPSLFRVYIPPGTTGINMSLYVSPVKVAAVVRMGQPPVNPNKPISEYGNIQSVGLRMNDVMNGGDFWTRNGDGNIQIFYGGAIDQTVLQSKAFSDRWIYIQVVNYDGAWLQTLTFNMTIGDMTAYRNWYNSIVDNWACYDNPGNAAKCSGIPTPTLYTVNFTAGTGGTVSSASQTVSHGGSTSPVTATPNSNYTFVNWTGPNGFTSPSNSLTVSNVMASATYTANFQFQPQSTEYSVKFLTSTGGTISGNISQTILTQGASCTEVKATPNSNYQFSSWTTGSGQFYSSSNPLTISNVTADMAVVANFQPIPVTTRTVTFLNGPGGLVIGNSEQKVIQNNNATEVKAIPDSGYLFENWTGTGGFTTLTDNPLIVKNVTSDMTITANFASVPTPSQRLKIAVDVPQDRIGRFAADVPRMITVDEAKSYLSVALNPELQFHNLPKGNYDLYAVVLVNGDFYVATKDVLPSQTAFVKWIGEEEVRSYDTKELSGDTSVIFTAFENIKQNATLPSPQFFVSNGFRFFAVIAPSGSSNLNAFLNSFRGAEIYFSSDIK